MLFRSLKKIPAIIKDFDDQEMMEIALIENIQREDLNPIEKARGFKQLIDEYGLKQQELADIMGMNRCTVTNCLRILNLDPRVIDLAMDGKLTEGHYRSLLGFEDPEQQYQMALKIVETGQTVRDIEDRFQGFFGTKVKLDAGIRSGKIIIKYSSNDDLERILDLINR